MHFLLVFGGFFGRHFPKTINLVAHTIAVFDIKLCCLITEYPTVPNFNFSTQKGNRGSNCSHHSDFKQPIINKLKTYFACLFCCIKSRLYYWEKIDFIPIRTHHIISGANIDVFDYVETLCTWWNFLWFRQFCRKSTVTQHPPSQDDFSKVATH